MIKNGLAALKGELEGYASTRFFLLSETKKPTTVQSAPHKGES
ncbi:hypothetical protein [Roseovarius sp. EL26]|nr:hypothetical protein [Roseovarius sp. EL26]